MTRADRTLATLMRGAQWRLDEAAFEVGAGRYTSDQRAALANALARLTRALREHAGRPPAASDVPIQ